MGSTVELLNAVSKKLECKSDADLARKLGLAPPTISKLRMGVLPVGPTLLINLNEETDFSIKELKALAGLPPATPMFV